VSRAITPRTGGQGGAPLHIFTVGIFVDVPSCSSGASAVASAQHSRAYSRWSPGDVYEQAVVKTVAGFFARMAHLYSASPGSGRQAGASAFHYFPRSDHLGQQPRGRNPGSWWRNCRQIRTNLGIPARKEAGPAFFVLRASCRAARMYSRETPVMGCDESVPARPRPAGGGRGRSAGRYE